MNPPSAHLCVCLTPLHVLIARRIAESRGLPFDLGLYLTSSDNPKQRHYAAMMNSFCSRTEYLLVPEEHNYPAPRHLSMWWRRLRHRLAFRRFGQFLSVYVPSSINHYVFILLSAVRFQTLVSFDDGMLNIQPDSPLRGHRSGLAGRLFYLAAGVCYWPERIRQHALSHYSIYEADNICAGVQRIRLIAASDQPANQAGHSGSLSLFIGPPPEASAAIWDRVREAVRTFKPDFFLPHPREREPLLQGVRYLDTPLVAEDYVLLRLAQDPGLAINLYGVDSSALINLAGTPRVAAYSLLSDQPQHAQSRQLMRRCGVILLEER